MSDPIYEILDNLRKEVQSLRVENDRLRRSRNDEIASAGDLRKEIERLRARIDANAIEYDRLLSRCAALEHVRQQAQALIDYEDAGPDDPAGKSWMHWEEKFEALRAALKEAPQ
jgi:chromosome segregation ATPase